MVDQEMERIVAERDALRKELHATWAALLLGVVPEEFKGSPVVSLAGALRRQADLKEAACTRTEAYPNF